MADERRDSLDESVDRIRQAMERTWRGTGGGYGAGGHDWMGTWREEREARRALRRHGWGRGSRARGAIFLGMAGVLTFLVLDGGPYWMMWVAFGMAMSGVGQFFAGGSRSRGDVVEGEAKVVAEPAKDPTQLARVDALCDKLLEEIRKGPAVLREVVRKPDESVRGLRDTIHALAKRESELRVLVTSEDGERLQRERVDVVARRDAASDPVTHERWDGALKALDAQLQHRETLRVQGARLEAERVRLGYTLENLYTQVLAVRSTSGSDDASAQLKAGVERLGEEISAVADALDSMQSVDPGSKESEENRAAKPRTRI